ncbi:MAG: diaminopimelate epimerase, partial [Acidimicrobiales bacterium]
GTRSLTVMADDGAAGSGGPGSSSFGRLVMVRAGMGKALPGPEPSRRWPEVGIEVEHQLGVDIGNPHLVAFVDSVSDLDMASIGPVIEADYPTGLNVHLVSIDDPRHLTLRVWERGAGVTEACGSGACAAAWAANSAGFADSIVSVDMPGGSADVELADDEIFLIGPAVEVGEVIVGG